MPYRACLHMPEVQAEGSSLYVDIRPPKLSSAPSLAMAHKRLHGTYVPKNPVVRQCTETAWLVETHLESLDC